MTIFTTFASPYFWRNILRIPFAGFLALRAILVPLYIYDSSWPVALLCSAFHLVYVAINVANRFYLVHGAASIIITQMGWHSGGI
uniref:Uncharacterized protein n=1 Tax=Caenorhabditis japonica TaxID=281687 RepID=A0A8R1EU37_CAEJA